MKSKQFLIIGLGRFGRSLAEELCKNGAEVMAVDSNADLVDDIQARVTHAACLDASDPDALCELGIQDFDVAVVTIGTDIRASSVITMLLKEMGIPLILAKAQDDMHGRMLEKLGADRIIFAERDMGRRIARSLVSDNILDYIEVSNQFAIAEIAARNAWLNQSLVELDFRKRYALNVIAIRSNGVIKITLDPDTRIRSGDNLLVVGEQRVLNQLEHIK